MSVGPWRPFVAALSFLTRLPIGNATFEDSELALSSAFFPLVGALVGAIQAITWFFVEPLIGSWAAAILVFSVGAWVTGGFHEDGLADTADALGGAMTRDKALTIFKDSRVGTFGVLALIFSVGMRVALLAHLPRLLGAAALIVMGALARVGPVWMLVLLPHASVERSQLKGIWASRPISAWVASVLGLVPVLFFSAWFDCLPFAALSIGLVVAATIYFSWRASIRLGGIVGDILGATEQLSEVLVLISLVAWQTVVAPTTYPTLYGNP